MKDYYAILHVLPSAEIDVIKAAYRALSRKYHPDTCTGDKTTASKKMQEINEAFGILGDPDRRKKYDEERKASNQEDEFTSNDNQIDARLEEDWKVAAKFCPEAQECFEFLEKLSKSLAFAYKSYLLDTKQFHGCEKLKDRFRKEFLTNFFGSDQHIQMIGESLVLLGEFQAAKSVNRAVKIVGNSLSPDAVIKRLKTDFPNLQLNIPKQFNRAIKYSCPKCDYYGVPKVKSQANYILLIFLTLLYLIPGFLYAFFHRGYNAVCPKCKAIIKKNVPKP